MNKIYSSSSNGDSNQTADKAFDGNPDTHWQAGSGQASGQGYNNSWIAVDFGANFTFNRVRLSESGSRTEGYRIEYWDGQTWQTAYEGTTLGNQPDFKTVSFAEVTGSKARAVFTSGTGSSPALCEFEVYFDNRVLDGVVSEWHLDNNLKDDVGDNDGVLKGSAAYGLGKAGEAIQLEANNSYVEISDSDSLDYDLKTMTLSAWVKINSLPVQRYGPVVKQDSYWLQITDTGKADFIVGTKNNGLWSPGTIAHCDTPLSIGNWYHLVGTYDGSFANLYVNGIKEGTGTQVISGSIEDTSSPFSFGFLSPVGIDGLDGMVDEVRLYRKALNDDEVKDLYDSYK